MGQKSLKGGSSTAGQSVLSQIDVEREINFKKQWEEVFEIQSGDMESKFTRAMFFSFVGKQRAVTQLPEISDERINDQENALKQSETSEKQVDVLLKTQEIMQRELLFDV